MSTLSPASRLRSLGLETLESRLNLSSLHGTIFPAAAHRVSTQLSSTLTTATKVKSLSSGDLVSGATGTTISATATTAVPITSYSAISNSQLEVRGGNTDIGYVGGPGAYVEYTVNVTTAGTYSLNLGMATMYGATANVSLNGTTAYSITASSTGSWDVYGMNSHAVTLSAGTNVIRITSPTGTQYNLNALSISPVGGTAVGADTTIAAATYSNVSNSRLESLAAIQDIGYVAPGAYVEYTINVATAGTYTLNIQSAQTNNSSFTVSSGGTTLATYSLSSTGSWTNYKTTSQLITLAAGTQVIRIASVNGTQYNLASLEFVLTKADVTTVTAPTLNASNPVTIATRTASTTQELDITGTSSADTISVSESGSTITVVANGQTTTYTGNYGSIAIWGAAGDDVINVASSVNLSTRVYGGDGTNSITNLTTGQATIITLGGGTDTVTGNGINTAYWVDGNDTVNASTAEKAAGDVHIVKSFYQPFTTDTTSANYITTSLNGQSITNPTADTSTTTSIASSSLFGTGAVVGDINQGQTSDCYFLASLESLAQLTPAKLPQLAVDLGDGTYAVAFVKNGVSTYVRVDADMASYSTGGSLYYAHAGATGDTWALVMEKAYAYFRTGSNSYASLNYGNPAAVYNSFGITAVTAIMPTSQTSFYATTVAKLAAGKGVDIGTNNTIASGVSLIGAHAYSVYAISQDSSGTVWVTLRNPWGFDGIGSDSNTSDGLVTMTYAQLYANSAYESYVF